MKITQKLLRQMAYGASYSRGEDYFQRGFVKNISQYGDKVVAKVAGSEIYLVKLWQDEDELCYECSCPVGHDGCFCKHCVAVGLTLLANDGVVESQPDTINSADMQKWLLKQKKEVLVDLLMEQVLENERLEQKLKLKIAKSYKEKINLSAYYEVIDTTIDSGGYVGYREAYGYVIGVEGVVESFEELLQDGNAEEVIDLVEYMIPRLEEEMNNIDDSDGGVGGVLHELEDLHFRACVQVKPDPEILARKLFNFELNTMWDTFYGAAEKYADILGKSGQNIYRTLTEKEWKKIKILKAGEKDEDSYGKRWCVTNMMETLARQTGDIEELVKIKQHDLSHSYSYLTIAKIYRDAKKYDKSVQWAEDGLKDFPGNSDSRIQDFLAEEYHRAGRNEEALELIWQQFLSSKHLTNYGKLKQYADYMKQWKTWRIKAIEVIRQDISTEKKEAKKSVWYRKPDHSFLVEIFLWENDVETAWLEAIKGGCDRRLWLKLAGKREKSHPQDAIKIYQEEIEPILDQKNNSAYEQAVIYLKKIGSLMFAIGQKQEFDDYVADVRKRHKPKRNFMKLLDKEGW